MPSKALVSPASVAATYSQNVANDDATNFTINVSGFLNGMVSAAIGDGSAPTNTVNPSAIATVAVNDATRNLLQANAQCIVEAEFAPQNWVQVYLSNPTKPSCDGYSVQDGEPNRAGILDGLGRAGFAMLGGASRIRIRRIDLLGGTCNAFMNFRESQ